MNAYIAIRKLIAALLAFALFGVVSGCANVAATNMVPELFGSAKRLDKTIQVVVDTTKANDHFKAWVVDAEFRNAIEQSLVKAKVFKDVRQDAGSDYQLRVTVTSIGNFWGLEARVAVNTTWEIIDLMRNIPIWKDVVPSEGVATVGDAFAGATRVRMMYERALKENIRKGIGQLSPTSAQATLLAGAKKLLGEQIRQHLGDRTFRFVVYDANVEASGTSTWDLKSETVSGNYVWGGRSGNWKKQWKIVDGKNCISDGEDKPWECQNIFVDGAVHYEVRDDGVIHAVSTVLSP